MENPSNPYSLKGKTAMITGGSAGIGFGIARQFIQLGARVAITGRSMERLEKAQKELGVNCQVIENDVNEKQNHAALVELVERELGELDILVNNAGRHLKKPALSISDEEFQSVMDTNLNSVFSLTRQALKGMLERKRGSVIFISSMAAIYGIHNVSPYSSAKTALLGLARSLATEYSHGGVRFNAIAPGFIESKMFLKAVQDDPLRKERILSRTPMGRFGKPEEIGMAAAFLASDASGFITGICLPVDGGNAIGF